MERRSTQSDGRYVHFGGDVTAHTNSSHGVRLSGGSTGGIVESVGDDTNVTLTLRAQGAANVVISSPIQTASTLVDLESTRIQVGSASTTGISLIQRHLIQFTVPALSSAGVVDSIADSTVTLSGATTNAFYIVQQRTNYNSTQALGIYVTARSSAADELTLTFWNTGPSSVSGSTASAYLLRINF